jgi:hypothetical protein
MAVLRHHIWTMSVGADHNLLTRCMWSYWNNLNDRSVGLKDRMLLKRSLARFRGLESQALLVWFSIASALWAFFTLGSEISEGDTSAFDRKLLRLLRHSDMGGEPIGPAWFKDSMRGDDGPGEICPACLPRSWYLGAELLPLAQGVWGA